MMSQHLLLDALPCSWGFSCQKLAWKCCALGGLEQEEVFSPLVVSCHATADAPCSMFAMLFLLLPHSNACSVGSVGSREFSLPAACRDAQTPQGCSLSPAGLQTLLCLLLKTKAGNY